MSRARACALILGAVTSLSARRAAAATIARVSSEASSVTLGRRVTLAIELADAYENPFDPELIQVDAEVELPSGASLVVPAFYTRDVARSLVDGREVLAASGAGRFALRFLPAEPGVYRFRVTALDTAGLARARRVAVTVRPGDGRGSVRVDPRDPGSFAWGDGTPFVPVGANVCWSTERSAGYDMEAYLDALAAAGLDWSRLWLTDFGEGWALEARATHPSGYYAGLGRYSLEVAARLDRVFEQAEGLGIQIEWALFQHSQFETARWSGWQDNPYNAARGGPAKDSAAFFEDAASLRLVRRELRYLVARYAAYRSLFAWEVMNEADGVRAPAASVARWCEARARDLRALDPYAHLVTTSLFGSPRLAALEVFASDAYDLAQLHAYGPGFALSLPADLEALRRYGKPVLLAELGLDSEGALEAKDPRGAHVAEASWIALASGFAGGAMPWWWDRGAPAAERWRAQTPVARAVETLDLRGMGEGLPGATGAVDADGDALDVFGRRGPSGALVLVRHPGDAWSEVAKAGAHPRVHGAVLSLPWSGGGLTAQLVDTASGEVGSPMSVSTDRDGRARVPLGDFAGSVLVEARPQ